MICTIYFYYEGIVLCSLTKRGKLPNKGGDTRGKGGGNTRGKGGEGVLFSINKVKVVQQGEGQLGGKMHISFGKQVGEIRNNKMLKRTVK